MPTPSGPATNKENLQLVASLRAGSGLQSTVSKSTRPKLDADYTGNKHAAAKQFRDRRLLPAGIESEKLGDRVLVADSPLLP